MSNFDSLTLALEGWFDTPRRDLPEVLRQRVEREILPMAWDQLSGGQRRSLAVQLDYQLDPAAEAEREFWWDFFERKGTLKTRIAEWEAASGPTASDLALRETRLAELRGELARMESRERRPGTRYYPIGSSSDSGASAEPNDIAVQYVAYPKAMQQLVGRLSATPEELAAWVWMGPNDGGIAAYLNANELDPPPRFHYDIGRGRGDDHDYISPLMGCWFRTDEVARFEPVDRYITGRDLIERWSDRPGLIPAAFIRAKIKESRLSDFHPIYGGTQGTFPEDPANPPLTTGLFRLTEVEAIEAEDFPVDWDVRVGPASVSAADSAMKTEAGPANGTVEAELGPGGAPSEVANRDEAIRAASRLTEPPTLEGPCAVFLSMLNLRADELSISFVGDRTEEGLGANNMLEVSARKQTRRVALAALDLVDRRKGGPNSLALILLGLAYRRKLTYSTSNGTKMKRLREVLRRHFGLVGDPFQPHNKEAGWLPRFKVVDKRGAADERAKREGERRTDSLDKLSARGAQFPLARESNRNFDDDGDEAGDWLRENDSGKPL